MDYFLIWAMGAAASAFFFGVTHPRKEVTENFAVVFFACATWPLTMPIVFATWFGQLIKIFL